MVPMVTPSLSLQSLILTSMSPPRCFPLHRRNLIPTTPHPPPSAPELKPLHRPGESPLNPSHSHPLDLSFTYLRQPHGISSLLPRDLVGAPPAPPEPPHPPDLSPEKCPEPQHRGSLLRQSHYSYPSTHSTTAASPHPHCMNNSLWQWPSPTFIPLIQLRRPQQLQYTPRLLLSSLPPTHICLWPPDLQCPSPTQKPLTNGLRYHRATNKKKSKKLLYSLQEGRLTRDVICLEFKVNMLLPQFQNATMAIYGFKRSQPLVSLARNGNVGRGRVPSVTITLSPSNCRNFASKDIAPPAPYTSLTVDDSPVRRKRHLDLLQLGLSPLKMYHVFWKFHQLGLHKPIKIKWHNTIFFGVSKNDQTVKGYAKQATAPNLTRPRFRS